MLPPLVGSPSNAYHCRSTTASGTPVLLQVKVAPWSSEREVLKFASVRSAKYRCPAESTPVSVSPPPKQVVAFPSRAVAPTTHLKVLPPSKECQIQLVSEESEPGTLVYRRFAFEGSTRRPCSKPTPPMPLMIGCPKLGGAGLGFGAPKLTIASKTPTEQRVKATKARGLKRPDCEEGFFFIRFSFVKLQRRLSLTIRKLRPDRMLFLITQSQLPKSSAQQCFF